MFDGSSDPLPWLSRMELLFKLQQVPDDQKTRYVAFHLTGAAQLWFIRSTDDAPMADWEFFTCSISDDFGPPICHETFGELASPRQTGTVDYYATQFNLYMLHAGTYNELQQINLFIDGLRAPLTSRVARHQPQEMETAIHLA